MRRFDRDAEPPAESALTVEAALRLPSLRRAAPEVLTGHGLLEAPIRWVHSSEVPDIGAHLKGGELLLVTGMGIDCTASGQRAYVQALAERRIACLVLELGQVFKQAPRAIVAAAVAHDLPFVVLHRAVPFVAITEEVHAQLVARQLQTLKSSSDLQHRLTEMILGGAEIAELLNEVAAAIANPIVLESADGKALFHAGHRVSSPDVIAGWERLVGGTRDAPNAATVPLPGRRGVCRLVALGLERPLSDGDRALLDRAADVVALAMSRSPEPILSARERGNFLADVAAGRHDVDDSAARARALGFEHPRGALLPIVLLVTAGEALAAEAEQWGPVWRAIRSEAASRDLPILLGPHTRTADTLAVVGLPKPQDRNDVADAIAAAAASAVRRRLGHDPSVLSMTVGSAVASWADLPHALRQSIEAAAATRDLPPRPWHDAAAADVDRLLWALRDDRRVAEFVQQRLGPILRHDARRAAKLLPTLDALEQHHWNKSDTARALHLNRQALYARMNRIARLLDVDLDDAGVRLGLALAVRARRTSTRDPGHVEGPWR